MSRPLSTLVDRVRATVVLVVVLVAGLVGGAWAASVATRPPVTVTSVADQGPGGAEAEKSPKAERTPKPEKSPKADKGPKPEKSNGPGPTTGAGPQGSHGACVSAVARDKDRVGGKNDNHGGAVSEAAHTCPKH